MSKSKKRKDNRVNLKLDPQLGDELDYISRITGKSKLLILHELLDSFLICASSFREFVYHVNVLGTQKIEINFFGKSAMISGAVKITSTDEIKEIESDIIDKASKIQVSKGMTLSNIAKQQSRAKIIKKVSCK